MSRTNKGFSLLLVVILAISSLIIISSVSAQSIPKPSVPQFTVKLVSHPYDVPPTTTTTIDQYTGKEIVTTTPGYHVENKSIEITIENQPLTTYSDAEGHTINIYYNVRVKGHFAQEWEWKELFSPYENPTREGVYWALNQSPIQSNSKNTVISCSAEYPDDAQVDFQVQALQGYFTKFYPYLVDAYGWRFTGQSSNWSSSKTVKISQDSTSIITPNPTSQPTVPLSPITSPTPTGNSATGNRITLPITTFALIIVIAGLAAAIASVLLYKKRQKSNQ